MVVLFSFPLVEVEMENRCKNCVIELRKLYVRDLFSRLCFYKITETCDEANQWHIHICNWLLWSNSKLYETVWLHASVSDIRHSYFQKVYGPWIIIDFWAVIMAENSHNFQQLIHFHIKHIQKYSRVFGNDKFWLHQKLQEKMSSFFVFHVMQLVIFFIWSIANGCMALINCAISASNSTLSFFVTLQTCHGKSVSI